MSIEITFVPDWAAKVIRARGADYKDAASILSKHDLKYYLLANHLFKAKLVQMGINPAEICSIADDWKDEYDQADVNFALFGATPTTSASEWCIDRFISVVIPECGYTVVETPSEEPKCFLRDYLEQIATVKGRDVPFTSSAYTRLLEHHIATLAV